MSAPARRGSGSGRWATVRYAIGGWGPTLRLCLIMIVMGIPPSMVTLLAHFLLLRR